MFETTGGEPQELHQIRQKEQKSGWQDGGSGPASIKDKAGGRLENNPASTYNAGWRFMTANRVAGRIALPGSHPRLTRESRVDTW